MTVIGSRGAQLAARAARIRDELAYDEAFIDTLLFGLRTCSTCGETKPASVGHFARDDERLDGLTSQCRGCRTTVERLRWADLDTREHKKALARARYRDPEKRARRLEQERKRKRRQKPDGGVWVEEAT